MEINRLIFEKPRIIEYYARTPQLTEAEASILQDYRDDFVNRRVLDLGVGAGRTVPSLAPLAASYVGIDYSRGMIEQCKSRFPRYHVEHGDARDLSRFASDSFDAIFFSFNGIDFVGHADRQTILREAARLLVAGGLLVFSSHSLQRREQQSVWRSLMRVEVPRTPFQAIKQVARIGWRLGNYIRHNHLQARAEGYAIFLDPGHDFTLPIYHVSLSEQERQLREAGFDEPRVVPEQHDDDRDEQRPYAFYFVARLPKP